MKKTEFINLIKEIVEDKVKDCLPQILVEMALNAKSNSKRAFQESEIIPKYSKPKAVINNTPIKQKKFSNNSVLNEILNQTDGGIPGEGAYSPMVAYDEHLNDTIYSEPITPDPTDINFDEILKKKGNKSTSLLNSMPKKLASVPPSMTENSIPGLPQRNYADFLKKVDQIANATRPV
jgi:hypothetical protein